MGETLLSAHKRDPIINIQVTLVNVLHTRRLMLVLCSSAAVYFKIDELFTRAVASQEHNVLFQWWFFMSLPEKTKVEVIQGDITDYGSVLEASRSADVIIHMASLVDVWHKIPDSLIHSVNIKGEG